jgi:predicted transcriptional regulator
MLSARLDEETEVRLKRLSVKQSVTKTEIVKKALTDYLDKQQAAQSAYALGKDLFGVTTSCSMQDSANYK